MSQVKLTADSGGGTTSLKGPSATTGNADVVLKLPVADGSSGQVLKTDGSGQLSFTSNAGTTINNNADNRVITGSGTANTLNAESNVIIDSSGNVGVGTTSPARHMHLNGSNSDTVQLHITNSTTGITGSDGVSFALGSDESLIINQRENNKILLKTNDTDRVTIDSSGNVGIGTASPAYTLDVVGDGGGAFSASSNSTQGQISIVGKNSSGSVSAISRIKSHPDGSSNQSHMAFETRNSSATMVEAMRIDSSGNVFLGATSYSGGGSSPKFYVSTTSDRAVKIHNTNSATSSVQITNAATGQGNDNGMQVAALSNGEGLIANAEAERILIQSQENDNNKPVVNFIKPQGPSNSQTTMIAFETGNQGRGAVLSSSSDGGSPSFASASDYRIKTNIRDYTDGYDNIKALPVKLFDMISDETKDIKGWIAHEVQAYIPEAVMGDKDAVDSNGKPILQQLSYGLFMPDVVGALQTAIAKIEALEAKVAALEAA